MTIYVLLPVSLNKNDRFNVPFAVYSTKEAAIKMREELNGLPNRLARASDYLVYEYELDKYGEKPIEGNKPLQPLKTDRELILELLDKTTSIENKLGVKQ